MLVLLGAALVSGASDASSLFNQAEVLFKAEDEAGARVLYESAAESGSADAHFALAYQYALPREEARTHLVAAARQGHGAALEYALEDLLFRAKGLRWARPRQAWELYQAAKLKNADLGLYEEAASVELLKMCAELPEFDVDAFCAKYAVDPAVGEDTVYAVWELAEEASRGGRFGAPDPELVFQLVVRGACVPAEFEYAVRDCYAAWKAGECREFNIGNYVTSGMGQGYCAEREHKKVEARLDARMDALAERLEPDAARLLVPARYAAFYFFECNAINAECHGGSGRAAWVLGSVMDQKKAYLDLLEKVVSGCAPGCKESIEEAESRLWKVYGEVQDMLGDKAADDFSSLPSAPLVQECQRVWVRHLEASMACFHAIRPQVSAADWRVVLIELRVRQLEELLELIRTAF
jgi:uncharacterized protein YecT (DUF1311 family)